MTTPADYFTNQVATISFDELYKRCVRELGMAEGAWNPTGSQEEKICDFIGDRLIKGYEEDWFPFITPVVERTVVSDNGLYVPFVMYPTGANSPYEPMDAIRWVTKTNPREAEHEQPGIPYKLSVRGIELPPDIGVESVFVEFRLRPAKVTRTPYSDATTYSLGDAVYDAGTKDCYLSLRDSNTDNALTDATWWERQYIPRRFVRYVAKGVYADWMRNHGDSQEASDRESARARAELSRVAEVARPQQRQIERALVRTTPT
jgi:hypothetical protein